MSLQLAAQHLADQGRGPDTTLVHMGQGEVQALQGLAAAAGGSLSTNPQTGLPEAGFLSSLLPMLAGAAGAVAAPFTGGIINPWTASALVGGITGLATGNLKKGLMAGLGAYGGFGLGSALGAAGAGASAGAASGVGSTSIAGAAPAATEAATEAAATGALEASTPALTPVSRLSSFAGQSLPTQAAPLASSTNFMEPITAPISKVGELSAAQQSIPTQALTPFTSTLPQSSTSAFNAMSPMDRLSAMGRGATDFDPLAFAKANKLTTAAAFAPAISGALTPKKYKEEPEDADRGTEYDYDPGTVSPFPTPDGTEQRYFNPRYVARTTSRFAMGGIADGLSSAQSHLGSYSAGGRGRLLRGPGDGVSDSIPATIGGKQPARLADGEFVIPARIVSELGNGSTEAGSKQLYAMMDRIQRARRKTTGKTKVAVNSKAHKLMPA